ncbi:MAG TPA: transglutaminase domain-containing protein [Sedimentisphaerales bacterium]|nr:transglutaminase domain-containing protein [Sedimentisphaerales bacterium]
MKIISKACATVGFVLLLAVSSVFAESGIIYKNPRIYNIDYSFELVPDPNRIDRTKDLKLWLPVPRVWDSQRAVKVISVDPRPHAEYTDPEHGNRMFFWDFGQTPEQPAYKVCLRYRLETYLIDTEIDPNNVGAYDRASGLYKLYTRSTRTVRITPQIEEMARQAVGGQTNPYRQAEAIFNFVLQKVRFKQHRLEWGVGTDVLLNHPLRDEETGEVYYEGACGQQHVLFVALCRARGIPARPVSGFLAGATSLSQEGLQPFLPIERELSPQGLAGTQHNVRGKIEGQDVMAAMPHVWAEFYLPGYGWVPVDLDIGVTFGSLKISRLIMSKGFDVLLGPAANISEIDGYGFQWVLTSGGRADLMQTGVWDIKDLRIGKMVIVFHNPTQE